MWLKILRQNISHLARRAKGSASIEQKNGNGNNKANKTNNNGADVNRNEEQNGSLDKSQAKKKPIVPGGTPLLQQTEISNSQLDFFRMLDEKIESGPDYDESSDATLRAEHVANLLRRWELASVTWSNAELNNSATSSPTPTLKSSPYQSVTNRASPQPQQTTQRSISYNKTCTHVMVQPVQQQLVSAKDREGMRNIIGGRPESAPVYVHPRISSANRLDGLQDVVGHHHHHHQPHCPSPNMPRHVLESISQSPTQSLKTPPSVASPPNLGRYPHYHHQSEKVVKVQAKSASPSGNPLNGESMGYNRERDYSRREQQQPYDSPILLRNSPSNPYINKFHINTSPQASPVQQQQQHQQQHQQRYDRKRTGGYGTAQMT